MRLRHAWRWPRLRGSELAAWDDPEPIRAELFGVERLEQHAESLAAAQTITAHPPRRRRLSPRVHENGRVLLESYRTIAEAIQSEQVITPAAEWLVDNFHIVEEQMREIREDLPPGYYRELPKLARRHLRGLSARLRPGVGLRRAHRQPLRARRRSAASCTRTSASSR